MTVKTADSEKVLKVEKDFQPLSFSENTSVEGPVAFVGYGLKTPGTGADAYDSYGDFDVKDKIVFVLAYVPESVSVDRRMHLNMYSGLRYKSMIARERGAKALIVVTGPTSPNPGKLIPAGLRPVAGGLGHSGRVRQWRRRRHAVQIVWKNSQRGAGTARRRESARRRAFDLTGVTASITTRIERQQGQGRNVLAYLPAANDTPETPVIVVGAHYDHSPRSNQLPRAQGRGEGHPQRRRRQRVGHLRDAGDRAVHGERTPHSSGAGHVRHRVPPRGPARSSASSVRAISSSNPTVPKERIAAYINFDMVGRLKNNELMVQGAGSSDAWKPLVEKATSPPVQHQAGRRPVSSHDVTAFYPKGVPVLALFTGSHEDYHRPRTTPGR